MGDSDFFNARREKLERDIIATALDLFGLTGAAAFELTIPGTEPVLKLRCGDFSEPALPAQETLAARGAVPEVRIPIPNDLIEQASRHACRLQGVHPDAGVMHGSDERQWQRLSGTVHAALHYYATTIRNARPVDGAPQPAGECCDTPAYCSSVRRCTAQDEVRATPPEPAPSAPAEMMRDAYVGAREDLLDWKRRAQRAEAELRRLGYAGIDASEPPTQPALTAQVKCEACDNPACWGCGEAIRPAPSAPSDVEALAMRMYGEWTDNQGIHCNRFPSWSELSESDRDEWRKKAQQAAKDGA